MKLASSIRAILAASAAFLTIPACGQNLIPNGRFDTNLVPWSYVPGTVTWASLDSDGSSSSGSALVVNSRGDFAPTSLKSPCTNAGGGNVGAKILVPSGQGVSGTVRVSLNWYLTSTGCTGTPIKTDLLTGFSPVQFDRWMSVRELGATYPFAGCTSSFSCSETSVQIEVDVAKAAPSASTFRAYVDDAYLRTGCTPDDQTLCLTGARFRVTADWESPTASGHAAGIQLNDGTGEFSFFSPDNTELVVKVLNACADPFNRFWVFGAGLTNVLVTLTVEDTQTGSVKTYINPQGAAFEPIQDTGAFSTCP